MGILSDETRNKAKQFKESRSEETRVKTARRSSVLGALDDALSGTYHGSLDDSTRSSLSAPIGGSLHLPRSAPGTPVKAGGNRRRMQRRSSCTIYNLTSSSHHDDSEQQQQQPKQQQLTSSTRKSPGAPPRSPRKQQQTKWSTAKNKSRSNSLSRYSSFGGDSSNTIDSPGGSSHHSRTIDERPLPLRNSSHHRRPAMDRQSSNNMSSSHHRRPSLTDDVSIVSVDDVGDHDENIMNHHQEPLPVSRRSPKVTAQRMNNNTIDQRPLPVREINVGAPTTPTSSSRYRTSVGHSGSKNGGSRSAPTVRRPWLPKSPGSLKSQRSISLGLGQQQRRSSMSNTGPSTSRGMDDSSRSQQRRSSSRSKYTACGGESIGMDDSIRSQRSCCSGTRYTELDNSCGGGHTIHLSSPPAAKKLKSPTKSSHNRYNTRRPSAHKALPNALPISI